MNKVRRISLMFIMTVTSLLARAQEGGTAYTFMGISESAHSTAVGGGNITIADDDITMMYTNPALLVNTSNKTINVDFTTYISSTNKFSAAYAMQTGKRGTWAVGAQVLSYGKMTETDVTGTEIGSFTASDIALHGTFAYLLSQYWSGAVTAKMLITNYANYNAFAMGVDLGLNYYNEDAGVSLSFVGRNFGGQLDPLYERREWMPFNLSVGISKMLSPVRLHLTFDDLTQWKKVNFIGHIVLGADVLIGKNVWVGLGYNFRRSNEMKVAGSSKWAGFSLGAGLNVKKFKFGVAWGRYHVAANSLVFNASYSL